MARHPSPKTHYDLEVMKITAVIRLVTADDRRGIEGDAWKARVADLLREACALLSKPPNIVEPSSSEKTQAR